MLLLPIVFPFAISTPLFLNPSGTCDRDSQKCDVNDNSRFRLKLVGNNIENNISKPLGWYYILR